ncbi:uncharacterized protein LOC143214465 isoform X2 [Lasioglossum baleicum]
MCNEIFLPKLINHLVANDLSSRLGQIQLSIFEDIECAIKSATTKSQQDQSVQTDLLITNSSVNTQTDETKLLVATNNNSPNNSNWRKQIINKTHSYPCMICNNYFKTYEKLEEHVKENHEEDLEVQLNIKNEIICLDRRFEVKYDELPWEREMVILTRCRIYFVNYLIRSNGQMKCFVRCIDSASYPSNDSTSYYTIALESASKLLHEAKVKQHTAECKIEDMYDVCFQETEIRSLIMSSIPFAFKFSLYNYK